MLAILTTNGNLGQRNQEHLEKNKTPENHISTTIFILQHHLQHLIIGFGISSKSSFTRNSLSPPPIANVSRRISSHTLTAATTKCTHHLAITAPRAPLVDQIPQQPALHANKLDTGEATAPLEEISENEAESFGVKCTFLSSFHFMPEDFDIDSHDFDFDTLRDKTNVKRYLPNKFKALASYRRKSFCY